MKAVFLYFNGCCVVPERLICCRLQRGDVLVLWWLTLSVMIVSFRPLSTTTVLYRSILSLLRKCVLCVVRIHSVVSNATHCHLTWNESFRLQIHYLGTSIWSDNEALFLFTPTTLSSHLTSCFVKTAVLDTRRGFKTLNIRMSPIKSDKAACFIARNGLFMSRVNLETKL